MEAKFEKQDNASVEISKQIDGNYALLVSKLSELLSEAVIAPKSEAPAAAAKKEKVVKKVEEVEAKSEG